MRAATLRALAIALGCAGLAGCAATPPPAPPKPPPVAKPDPEQARRIEASRFQKEVVMAEVTRTHPVLSATLDRNLEKLEAAIKAKGNVNEVRRDMRLGPPLREACRLGWKAGIDVLESHNAQCLGDAKCEACVKAQAPHTGN